MLIDFLFFVGKLSFSSGLVLFLVWVWLLTNTH